MASSGCRVTPAAGGLSLRASLYCSASPTMMARFSGRWRPMLPAVCPGRCTTRASVGNEMLSPSSSLESTVTGLPMSLVTRGCPIFANSPFCAGFRGGTAPAMMSASSRWTATVILVPETSSLRPPEWSGCAWVRTTHPIWSKDRPRALSPLVMRPELPRNPASTNKTAPSSTKTVTRAPMVRIWNTPFVIRIGLPNIKGLVWAGVSSND